MQDQITQTGRVDYQIFFDEEEALSCTKFGRLNPHKSLSELNL